MSKQKKKKSNAQQKVQLAQGKNEYKRRLNQVCMMLPEGKTASKVMEKYMDIMYSIRPQPVRIVFFGKDPSDFEEYVKSEYPFLIKHETLPMYEGGPEISLYDYFHLVRPLQMFVDVHSERHSGFADPFAPIICERKTRSIDVVQKMARIAEVMGLSGSNFMEFFYHVKFVVADPLELKTPRDTCSIEITYEAPTWKQIKIGTQKRTAARVGWRFPSKIVWMEIKPSQMGIRNPADDSPMEVYMLQHAINRLYERIGGTYRAVMHMDMFQSFHPPRAFPTGGGNFLIEYKISEIKAGYFAATITEGALLIRTFLFITHAGTPEGKKLTALTGLRKWDHKYWAFDNLLSLTDSDLFSNEETCEIFREAGCGGLIELCDKVRLSNYWESSDQKKPIADKMLQYIKSGKEEVSDLWTELPDDEPEPAEPDSELQEPENNNETPGSEPEPENSTTE